MKCIHCGTDSTYNDRGKEKRCKACKHPFAFEPRTDTRSVTDPYFQKSIENVSAKGTLRFTERQLWWEFNRKWARSGPAWPRVLGWTAGVAGGGGTVIALISASAIPFIGGVAVAMSVLALRRGLGRRRPAPRRPKVAFDAFRSQYLSRWLETHGPIGGLLPPLPPALPGERPPPPPDITAFSFDRALVVQHDALAAMLVANNFHFENNCAVLGLRGYPYGVADTVMQMLRRNPRLTVFALHDASHGGCALPHVLRGGTWFPDGAVRLVDLGLRPAHARQLGLLDAGGERRPAGDPIRASLTAEEVLWLEEGHAAEVAALRPARLLRAIYRGIARTSAAPSDSSSDGTFIWIGGDGASDDATAPDSFG